MSVLMCKNVPVYDIETSTVLCDNLLPGLMRSSTFKDWFKLRYSSDTNTLARKLQCVTFKQGNRVVIDETTHALSLSDCYWVQHSEQHLKFEDISPYFTDYWNGEGVYRGGAIPTFYVGGYLTKGWHSNTVLVKYGKEALNELPCYELCRRLQVPCAEVKKVEGEEAVAVSNITTQNVFLEQADMSGKLDPDYFDDDDVVRLFDWPGARMLIIDAVVGNGDRHAGNFGWMRDCVLGLYLRMAPLYDFDHAFDTVVESDILTDSVLPLARQYKQLASRLLRGVVSADVHEVFTKRARTVLNRL